MLTDILVRLLEAWLFLTAGIGLGGAVLIWVTKDWHHAIPIARYMALWPILVCKELLKGVGVFLILFFAAFIWSRGGDTNMQ